MSNKLVEYRQPVNINPQYQQFKGLDLVMYSPIAYQ
jgi:hypothetical protein